MRNLTQAAARWVARPFAGRWLWRVGAVNTFCISAGRFAYFRVVSRPVFPQVSAISEGGSIPSSSTEHAGQSVFSGRCI